MKTGIMFDMDGTLWDSTKEICYIWNEVLKEYGVELSMERLQSLMGKTMDVIAENVMPEKSIEERKEIFDRCLQVENEYLEQHGGILYPQLEETLKVLKETYPLYIVSNCQSGYIEAFLKYYKFEKYFDDFECFGNTGKGKAYNQKLVAERNQLDRVIYVGDIQGDYEATMEAGFEFIHAAYGFGTVDADVKRLKAFSELPKVLADM
ncbi:putative uncharacterized protein [Clostridium sp. CAG:411]|jgi:phosphoglycolate phosphatase|nr:HAD family hydrolase [Lachnospiraceae bacterium]CDE44889.1 putative uncharacterized protein [Clostridium sp. CAG:411]